MVTLDSIIYVACFLIDIGKLSICVHNVNYGRKVKLEALLLFIATFYRQFFVDGKLKNYEIYSILVGLEGAKIRAN